MSRAGWIKLYRNLEDDILNKYGPYDKVHAWIDLILCATSKEENKDVINGNLVKIRRGEVLTSVRKLAKKWSWSEQKVRRFLITLETLNRIKICNDKIHKSGTLLSIVNYDFYQGQWHTNDTTHNSTNDTIHNSSNGRSKGTVTRDSTVDIKEDKEYKNKEKKYKRKESGNALLSDESMLPQEVEETESWLDNMPGDYI